MKPNWKKVVGVVVPLASAAVSVAANWWENKKLDDTITEKVAEALKSKAEESK